MSTKPTINAADPESILRAALDAFETSLAVPIVAGELDEWSQQVRTAWAEASAEVHRQLTQLHPAQLKQIAKEDPELSTQVDLLRAEDAALEEDRACLDGVIERLARLVPMVEPNERIFHEYHAQLQKDGVDFITRVKKQQVALQTWFQEAFNRDRGVAD
jgi:hypothetical protein